MDLKDIQNLIKFVAKSGASEVKLEMEDIKITVKTGSEKTETTIVQQAIAYRSDSSNSSSAITPAEAPAAPAPAKAAASTCRLMRSKYLTITSPIIGTFYRKPSPDKPMFVEVGDVVS